MKKERDPYKEWEKIQKKIERDDEELLRLLDEYDVNEEDEEDDDDDYDRISITYKPPVYIPEPETPPEPPKRKGSPLVGVLCVIFIIALIYTFYKFVFKQELHLVPLAITLISFVIIEVVKWQRKRK